MAKTNYTPMPKSLNQDERLTEADPHLRLVYLCLRLGSDSHGRFFAAPTILRAVSGIMNEEVAVQAHFERLVEMRMINAWRLDDGRRCAEIADYDEGLTKTMQDRRGESEVPKPAGAGRLTHESVTSQSRVTHESVASDPGVAAAVCAQPPEETATPGSVASQSRVSHPSRARASLAEPSLAEPNQDETSRAPAREAPTHTDGPDTKQDPAQLSPAARSWLEHRVEVTRRNGHAMATMGEAEDLLGFPLRALQRKPGFSESVAKMLALPDSKWGRSLRAGFAYLERMVADYIPEQAAATNEHQSHMGGLAPSCEEYYERTGFDPRQAETYDPLEELHQQGAREGAGA